MFRLKRLTAIAVLIVMSLSFLIGCNLITKNSERDLDRIVATVGTGSDTEQITKRELVTYYLNNGGTDYVEQGYTVQSIMESFIEQLISRKIFLIEAKKNLPSDLSAETKYKYASYFTAEELINIEREIDTAEYDKLKELEKTIEDEWYPAGSPSTSTSPSPSPRPTPKPSGSTAPSAAPTYPAEDATPDEIDLANETKLRLERQLAKENTTREEYYKRQVENLIEQRIIDKYKEEIYRTVVAAALTDVEMQIRFNNLLEAQKEQYRLNPSAYFTDITALSEDKFLLYYPTGGYLMVKNLLIKFDEETDAMLKEIKAQISEIYYYNLHRSEQINKLVAKDLRDVADGSAHDYGIYDTAENTDPNEGTFFEYVQREIAACATDAEKFARFVELIFIYGEDTGMFNNAFDYVVGPAPQPGATESYVTEFANASRALAFNANGDIIGNMGDIVAVETDFGLHIIMLTGIAEPYEETYNHSEKDTTGTFSYRFYNSVFETQKTETITKMQTDLTKAYYDAVKVVKFEKIYKDLWA
jgi:hypothetical protein